MGMCDSWVITKSTNICIKRKIMNLQLLELAFLLTRVPDLNVINKVYVYVVYNSTNTMIFMCTSLLLCFLVMEGNHVCEGCLRDDIEEVAYSWCKDCEEPVCIPCCKAHRRYSVPHDVTDIKDIAVRCKTFPKTCKEHTGQKLIFFCVIHDTIICSSCFNGSHKECEDIYHIEKAAKGIKESSALYDIKERINNQQCVIEKVKNEYDELSSKINWEKDQQLDRLTNLRSAIDVRLNHIKGNINTHYNNAEEQLATNSKMLKSLKQTTEANIQEIENANTEASEVNLFHLVKYLDTSQLANEGRTDSLKNDINFMKLQFIPEDFIEKVDAMFSAFDQDAQMRLSENLECSHKIQQSQLHVSPYENQVHHTTKTFCPSESHKFYACCFIDENKIITIEDPPRKSRCYLSLRTINIKDGQCHSMNPRGNIFEISKQTICAFDNNNVLLVGPNLIFVIDLEMEKLARTISLNDRSTYLKWVTCIERQIVVLCVKNFSENVGWCISWIDYNGISIKTLDLLGDICDLDINETHVFCTFNDKNNITSTTFNGVTNTCYTSFDLREKCQIAAGDSIIYLLEQDRNAVYGVDLKTKQRSIFHEDEITRPTFMYLDKNTKQLAVICDAGNCLKIFDACI